MSDPYFRWHKGDKCHLSDHFSTIEFTCQCDNPECIDQMIAIELVEKLQRVRDLLGAPLTITSGFRCKTHQQELTARGCETAKSVSQHELGNAADIARGCETAKSVSQHELGNTADIARGCETAKSVSQHELGNTADIVSSDLKALAKLVEKEFSAIGYSSRFFHVDLRSDRQRYWTYKN